MQDDASVHNKDGLSKEMDGFEEKAYRCLDASLSVEYSRLPEPASDHPIGFFLQCALWSRLGCFHERHGASPVHV